MSAGADSEISTAPEPPQSTSSLKAGRKPRFAFFVATACGLGYLPKAPGTWGSLGGALIYYLIQFYSPLSSAAGRTVGIGRPCRLELNDSAAGCDFDSRGWRLTSHSVAKYSGTEDPQCVVIDEVSGQLFTYCSPWPPPTGNICCWVLYFFECLIFGSRFRRGRRNRCRAVGESWRMIGPRQFTRGSDCGSRARRGFEIGTLRLGMTSRMR